MESAENAPAPTPRLPRLPNEILLLIFDAAIDLVGEALTCSRRFYWELVWLDRPSPCFALNLSNYDTCASFDEMHHMRAKILRGLSQVNRVVRSRVCARFVPFPAKWDRHFPLRGTHVYPPKPMRDINWTWIDLKVDTLTMRHCALKRLELGGPTPELQPLLGAFDHVYYPSVRSLLMAVESKSENLSLAIDAMPKLKVLEISTGFECAILSAPPTESYRAPRPLDLNIFTELDDVRLNHEFFNNFWSRGIRVLFVDNFNQGWALFGRLRRTMELLPSPSNDARDLYMRVLDPARIYYTVSDYIETDEYGWEN